MVTGTTRRTKAGQHVSTSYKVGDFVRLTESDSGPRVGSVGTITKITRLESHAPRPAVYGKVNFVGYGSYDTLLSVPGDPGVSFVQPACRQDLEAARYAYAVLHAAESGKPLSAARRAA